MSLQSPNSSHKPLQSSAKSLLHPLQFVLGLAPNWGRLLVLASAAIISAIVVLGFRGSLGTVEERLGTLGWTLSADTTLEQRIILVTVDEQSLAEVGPWPWSRPQMAELVSAIDNAGAQLQLHDIFYPEARPGDAELLAAMQAARGVVLAQVPVLQSDQQLRTGQMTHPVSGVNCAAPAAAISLASTGSFVASHSLFSGIATGHITPIVASDGAIRQFPALICVDGAAYPAISISALLQATGNSRWGASVTAGDSLFDPPYIMRLDAYPGLDIPLDQQGNVRISYKQAPQSYQAVSAADVLAGTLEPGILDNAWVIVGATALSMGDIVPTPYSGSTPGVELQARILGSMLDAQIPYTPRSSNFMLALISLLFGLALLKLAGAQERLAAYGLPAAGVLLPLAALGLHIFLLNSSEIWLGWLYPAAYALFATSLLMLLEHRRVRGERSRVFENLSSYLPSDIAQEIAFSLPSSRIDARRCDFTMLSADLRNFAAFSEKRPPEETAAVLHFFFVRATEIIEQHGGRVHEFKGDGLLAVWDGSYQQAAEKALQAAQQMQQSIDHERLSIDPAAGLEPLAIGIGIEQGPALIGSVGPAHRRSHSLLGDTVTITLRIQELTAELAQPILIGECAARHIGNEKLESQGSFLLNGLSTPHTLFSPAYPEASAQSSQPRQQPKLKVVTSGKH